MDGGPAGQSAEGIMIDLNKASEQEIVAWARRFDPCLSEDEALAAYVVYRQYIDEGQSSLVARQYAGLL